ncbi:MAG: FMN-binding protein, partial [Candidatus Aminicenantes bacterium]
MKKFERIAAAAALGTIILAWILGGLRQEADLVPFIKKALPGAIYLESVSNGIYAGKASNQPGSPVIGYAAIGKAGGYGGPMRVAVGVEPKGGIIGIVIVDHKETIPFFQKVLAKEFPRVLLGKNYSHSFTPGEDVDTVSGATLSLNALVESVRQAVHRVAKDALDLPVKPEKSPPIHFGIPEVILLLLFAVGFVNYWKKIDKKHKKAIRWVTRLTGLLFLGFVYTIPLSIININSL